MDMNQEGNISYTEFIAATMSSESTKKTQLLKEVFDFLDKAREAKIEFEEVMRVVQNSD